MRTMQRLEGKRCDIGEKPTTFCGAVSDGSDIQVKCKINPGQDVCKRCFSARSECNIPDRKERRPPPYVYGLLTLNMMNNVVLFRSRRKRDSLLMQIRKQTELIDDLMRKLEENNRQKDHRREEGKAGSISHDCPTLSHCTTADSISLPSYDDSLLITPGGDASDSKDFGRMDVSVTDWMSMARENIQAFSEHVSSGKLGAVQNTLVTEEDQEMQTPPVTSESSDSPNSSRSDKVLHTPQRSESGLQSTTDTSKQSDTT